MLSHEPIEWPDEVEVLVDRLESESAKRTLTREERAFMSVGQSLGLTPLTPRGFAPRDSRGHGNVEMREPAPSSRPQNMPHPPLNASSVGGTS